MNKSIYITTSIPYVNSKPHVGHAQEFILADCLARSYRALGHQVRFQTGTDENAFKNVVAARAAGVSPQEFVDRNAEIFRDLVTKLEISADTFIRTTEVRHRRGVEKFWSRLSPEDLYQKSYSGLYCIGCEDFYLEKDLENGLCPDHKSKPDQVEEKNVFFRLSKYQERLEKLIVSEELKIYPESRRNEALSFLRQGLQDISLTRSSSRSGGWGISAPGHTEQVIYVWIDALINYISGQGFGDNTDWQNIWNEATHKVHIIGKNVWKFHAIYWPALLLSAGLPVPNEIVVHGFLTNNGVKISKSLGNTIDPIEVASKFGADAVRHLLLTYIPIFSDSDFSTERVGKVYVDDLAHRLGNLFSRLHTLCEKAGVALEPQSSVPKPVELKRVITDYEIQEVSLELWQKIDAINAEINHRKPWELVSATDPTELHGLLKDWVGRLFSVATALHPFIPSGAEKVLQGLQGEKVHGRILFPLS